MSVECAECERDLRGGHNADCSRRCQAMHSDGSQLVQCERAVGHPPEMLHALFGPDEDSDVVYTWADR